MLRISTTDYDGYFQKVFSVFGSEIRDGLKIHEYFSENEIKELRKNYISNTLISSIPGYSKLNLLDPEKFRENLISYRYSSKLGLDKSYNIKGIRVGIIREVELLFGNTGLVVLVFFVH